MDGNLLVERIRLLCRQNETSLTKLEAHFGFGNGAIGKWKKTNPPYERLQKVADYFGVTVAELTGEEQKNKPALPMENELSAAKEELWYYLQTASDEEAQAILNLLKAKRMK